MFRISKTVSKDALSSMKLAFRVLLFASVFSLSSCKYNAAKILANPEADYLIKVKSEACLGTCPVYSIQLNAKRELSFQGANYCAFQGDTTLSISEEDYQNLKNQLLSKGFFALDSVYDNPDLMDGINYTIELSDPQFKFETHRVRTRADSPRNFNEIKKHIGMLLRSYGLLK